MQLFLFLTLTLFPTLVLFTSLGMAFIHDRGYTHRDLKSPNVLYDDFTMRAKVADFGMSTSLDDDDDVIKATEGRVSIKTDGGCAARI